MIQAVNLGCGLLLLLCVTSCRSERVVFIFQPAATQAPAPDTLGLEEVGVVVSSAAHSRRSTLPVLGLQVLPATRKCQLPGRHASTKARREQLISERSRQSSTPAEVVTWRKHSIDDPPWGGILFLAGGAISIAAVVIGFHMGSWLGLGVGTLMYLVGAYMAARGFAGPNEPATNRFAPMGPAQKVVLIRRLRPQKSPQRPVATAGLGETIFTLGTLTALTALVLGLTGALSANFALLLGLTGLLLAGIAYGGIK